MESLGTPLALVEGVSFRGIKTIYLLVSLVSSLLPGIQAWAEEELSVHPDDPYYSSQGALSLPEDEMTNNSVSAAWEITTDASSVIVAVIDTGVELAHPDLTDNLWINANEIPDNGLDDDENGYADDVHGYDFKHEDGSPEDEWGHGTLTAGIIGAVGNNGIGTAGVAWKVQLMILKVFGDSGGGTVDDFSEAIRYAIHNGARIINASWTVPESYPGDQIPELKAAMVEAQEAGILVVAAAGNDGADLDDSPVFPASYLLDNLVSVAALDAANEDLLYNSNYNHEKVTVAAPGEDVIGPYLSEGYATLTGTSSATALTSGVAALMIAENDGLSASQIRSAMIDTSDPSDTLSGVVRSEGTLNPYGSVSAALTADTSGGSSSATEEAGVTPTPSPSASSGGCSLMAL